MTVGKDVGLHDYGVANYAFDRESAAINFWRDPLNHYTTLSIGRLQYFLHSYKPLTLPAALGIRYKLDLSLMQRSMPGQVFSRTLRFRSILRMAMATTSHCRRIETRGVSRVRPVRATLLRIGSLCSWIQLWATSRSQMAGITNRTIAENCFSHDEMRARQTAGSLLFRLPSHQLLSASSMCADLR